MGVVERDLERINGRSERIGLDALESEKGYKECMGNVRNAR